MDVYDPDNLPLNETLWDEPRFVHKTHWGFYSWPKEMYLYAPSNQQPELNRKREELNDVEKEIYDTFNDEKFIDKLIHYLSLEEFRGATGRINFRRTILFL